MRNIPVMKAVAYPPTLLFVPFELAMLIITGHAVVLLLGVAIIELNPLIPLSSLIVVWIVVMGIAAREPHLVSLAKTVLHPKLKNRTRNLVKSEGAKYVP